MYLLRGPLTGGKTLAIFVTFFGVVISVNLVLAYQAVSTFPGVETANSYVASQTFNDDRAAQEALGWTAQAQVLDGTLVLSIVDATGQPVEPASVFGIFGRPTTTRDDQNPEFTFDGAVWYAPVTAGLGQWNLRLNAIAPDGTQFRQRIVVVVN